MEHLRAVLTILLANQLYAKQSKCAFGCVEVEYLGHIISGQGVKIDPTKTEAMLQWHIPKSVKALRGFLGLTRYYRKFIQSFGVIEAPLNALLKKEAFQWTSQAESAFNALKLAVSRPPVLALPDFSKLFVVECDACGVGLGVVLMPEGRPLGFHSEALKGRCLHLSLPMRRSSWLW